MRKKKTNAPKDNTPIIFGKAPSTVPTKAQARNCETQNPQASAMATLNLGCVSPPNF